MFDTKIGMFDFYKMLGNYEERKVDRYEKDDIVIDTCLVTDGQKPYETGVRHPEYNNGKWIIVEAYDTKEYAQRGHERWIFLLTSSELPSSLTDCCNAETRSFLQTLGMETEYPRMITVECKKTLKMIPLKNGGHYEI